MLEFSQTPDTAPVEDEAPAAAAPAPPAPAAERMLRLLPAAGGIERLRAAPIIVRHAQSRGVVRRLETLYYDTADHALCRQGLSLRVRRHGRRFTQTLREQVPERQGVERQAGAPAGPFGGTWQAAVEGAAPDLERLAAAAPEPRLAALLGHLASAPLTSLFETRLRRLTRRLALPGAVIDAVFEDGVIAAGGQARPLAEIRLVLRAGDPGMLYEVAMRLLELAPLRISTCGTLRRGYALAAGTGLPAEKAAPSGLPPGSAVDDVVAGVLAGCEAHLHANQPVAEEGSSPEGVHQTRVALRRMRTALSLLRREIGSATMLELGGEARWAAAQLGAARGWDVFLTTTLERPARLQDGGIDFDGLRQVAALSRAAGYDTVRETLGCDRFARFQLSLGQWIARRGWRNEVDRDGLGVLAEPAAGFAVRVLDRLHRRALRQGAHFRRLSAGERHQLRITLKKLRYASEFFLPLCAEPDRVRRFLRRLSGLQEALGLDHDAATTRPLLQEIGLASSSTGVHQALGVVIGWQARDGLAAREQLNGRWRQFKAMPPFWSHAAVGRD